MSKPRTCAREGCTQEVVRRPGAVSAKYCSPRCYHTVAKEKSRAHQRRAYKPTGKRTPRELLTSAEVERLRRQIAPELTVNIEGRTVMVMRGAECMGSLKGSANGEKRVVLRALAFPKIECLKSPTWLRLVRMLPCAICGRWRDFYEQLQLDAPQSEANHYPGRGRAAGGSDLETHPACPACHLKITENRLPDSDRLQTLAVQRTTHTIFTAIREGRVPADAMLAVALELIVNQ